MEREKRKRRGRMKGNKTFTHQRIVLGTALHECLISSSQKPQRKVIETRKLRSRGVKQLSKIFQLVNNWLGFEPRACTYNHDATLGLQSLGRFYPLLPMLNKGPYSQRYGFSSNHVCMWVLDPKEDWMPKNWCFRIVVLEKTLEGPLDSKEIKPVNPKANQP